MTFNLDKITKRFLLGESIDKPSLKAYLQSIEETLNNMSPRRQGDSRKLEVARSHMREVRRHVRKLEEKVQMLEEKVTLLEGSNKEE